MAKEKATRNKAKDVVGIEKTFKVIDRIGLLGLLPKEANIINMTLAKDIREKVDFTQDEMKKFDMKSRPDGKLAWKIQKKGVKIKFTGAELELLRSQVDLFDKQNKITAEMLPVCFTIREK